MSKFKVGDTVIVVLDDVDIQFAKIEAERKSSLYAFVAFLKDRGDLSFTAEGKFDAENSSRQDFFPATPENIAAINQLYGADLKLPMTPNEVVKAMLDRGDKYVVCKVSDVGYARALQVADIRVIVRSVNYNQTNVVMDVDNGTWQYAIPIDPKTGLEITEQDL